MVVGISMLICGIIFLKSKPVGSAVGAYKNRESADPFLVLNRTFLFVCVLEPTLMARLKETLGVSLE